MPKKNAISLDWTVDMMDIMACETQEDKTKQCIAEQNRKAFRKAKTELRTTRIEFHALISIEYYVRLQVEYALSVVHDTLIRNTNTQRINNDKTKCLMSANNNINNK